MARRAIRPMYAMEPVKRAIKTPRVMFRKDEADPKKLVRVEVDEKERGWMVYFPAGHSIRILDEKELKRLGFDQPAGYIDEEGEPVDVDTLEFLKQKVRRATAGDDLPFNVDEAE